MTDSTTPPDINNLQTGLAERAAQVCRQLEHWLSTSGRESPPGDLWRETHGLAGAASVLGLPALATSALAIADVLREPDADSRQDLSALRDSLARLASDGVGAGAASAAFAPDIWLAVGDAQTVASLGGIIDNLGLADTTRPLEDAAALPELCHAAPGGVLLCDAIPDCMAALQAANWRVIVVGGKDTDEARVAAIRAGVERYLPAPHLETQLAATLSRLPGQGGASVLLVDEDSLSLNARAAVLEQAGFRVQTLQQPLSVAAALRETGPDVILADGAIDGLSPDQFVALLGSVDESWPDALLLVGGQPPDQRLALATDAPPECLLRALSHLAGGSRARMELARNWHFERERRQHEHRIVNAHGLVSITDRAGRITFANDQFCAVSGYSREELLGQTHRIVKSDQHSPAFYTDIWRTIACGGIWHGLICNRRRDGRLYWVLSTIAPYLDDRGKPQSYISLRTEVTELKLLQEQVRLRDRALQETFNGISIADAKAEGFPLIFVNSGFEKITGYSSDEALGRNCRFLQKDDTEQAALDELRQALEKQESVSVVLRNYRKDGSLFWNDLNLSPILDDKGQLTHYIGIQRDITRRVNDELALRESEENLRAVLEATDDEILAVDEQRRTIFCSHRFGDLSLFRQDSLRPGEMPVPDHDLIQHQVRQPGRYEERLEEIYAQPDQASHDICERMDGRIIERDSMPLMRNDRIAGRVWHFKDVTNLHWVQREMESYKERLRLGQNYANIGTWDWDIEGGGLFWTERIPALFGYPEGELETSFDNFAAALHPDDRDSVINAINATIEKDVPYSIEHRVIWPDGTTRWLNESGAVIRDKNGKAIRMVGVVQDIDDRKRAEIELLATREEAERANQAKSEFLSRMSHELRTPMNAVLGFAQIMEYDDTLPESHLENVTEIMRAGNHLLALINEVLDLAKVESGSIDLSIEVVELCSVMEECLSLIRPIAERKDIVLTPELGPPYAVRADRMRLKQALLNLMSNGIKYNRDEGTLTISLAEVRDGDWIQIRVTDTGRGLRPEEIARIFEPFERLGDNTDNIEGSGIGLTITRRLVDMMGGNLGVDSTPGRGSTFWIELPREAMTATRGAEHNDPEDARPPREKAATETDERTVIYIEDNPSNIRLMAQILSRRQQIRLRTAHTPDLGIELALSRQPDLILLDINLPGLDGYQVLRILKTDPRLKPIPVIALSANALPRDIDRGRQAGFADYITKPLQINYFLKVLDRYLGTEPEDGQT